MRKSEALSSSGPLALIWFAARRDFLFPYGVANSFHGSPLASFTAAPRASRKSLSVFGVAMNRDPSNLLLNPHGVPAAMHRRLPAGPVGCSPIPKSLIQAAAVRHSAAKPQASRDNCRRSTSEHIADSSAAAAASGYFMSQTLSSVPDKPLCQRQHRMGQRVGREAAKRRIE